MDNEVKQEWCDKSIFTWHRLGATGIMAKKENNEGETQRKNVRKSSHMLSMGILDISIT